MHVINIKTWASQLKYSFLHSADGYGHVHLRSVGPFSFYAPLKSSVISHGESDSQVFPPFISLYNFSLDRL